MTTDLCEYVYVYSCIHFSCFSICTALLFFPMSDGRCGVNPARYPLLVLVVVVVGRGGRRGTIVKSVCVII